MQIIERFSRLAVDRWHAVAGATSRVIGRLFGRPSEKASIMDDVCQVGVEFVGGPYDGHIEWFFDVGDLIERPLIAAIVSHAALGRLSGATPRVVDPPTGLALYRLQLTPRGWRYFFLRVMHPSVAGLYPMDSYGERSLHGLTV